MNPAFTKYQNHHMFPFLMSKSQFKEQYSMTWEDFVHFRTTFVEPLIDFNEQYTADTIAGSVIIKLVKNTDFRTLAVMHGCSSTTVIRWFREVISRIYANHPFLIEQRNLNNPAVLQAFFARCHEATLSNTRTCRLYQPWVEAYMQRHPEIVEPILLVVLSWDGTETKIPKSRDAYLQFRTFSSKSKCNAFGKLVGATPDGCPQYVCFTTITSSPAGTDEKNMKHIITIEEEGDLQGLTAILKRVPQNYFLVNLLDRGFLRHGLGPYLLDVLDEVEQETDGRVMYCLPTNAGGMLRTETGLQVRATVPVAGLQDRGRLLLEEEANSSRAFCTSTRYSIENAFIHDWRYTILGNRDQIPYAFMSQGYFEPTPQAMTITVLHGVVAALTHSYRKGFEMKYSLPEGVTYEDQARHMLHNLKSINWLDPLRQPEKLFPQIASLFKKPTLIEIRNNGMREVSVFNQQETFFPSLTKDEMRECFVGPYTLENVEGITTLMRRKDACHDYENLENFHAQMLEAPRDVRGYFFEPGLQPANYSSIFETLGLETPAWRENLCILIIPEIPSRMATRQKTRVVVLAYQRSDSVGDNALHYESPPLHNLVMWACGPRGLLGCPWGARTVSPCSHCATGIYLAGVLSQENAHHRSTHRKSNFLDPGFRREGLPVRSQTDILANFIQ